MLLSHCLRGIKNLILNSERRKITYSIRIGNIMKKLTITVDDEVYEGLHTHIGRGNISRFPTIWRVRMLLPMLFEAGYAAMAADKEREQDAIEWAEQGMTDLTHEET